MQSLADWIRNLSGTNIPVLAQSIGDLARLQANEDNVTARDLSQIVLRDPLMTLKILRFSQSRLTQSPADGSHNGRARNHDARPNQFLSGDARPAGD